MKLNELLEVLGDNNNIQIKSIDNKLLSEYDGKNSINNCLNKYEVLNVNIITMHYTTLGLLTALKPYLEIIIDYETE